MFESAHRIIPEWPAPAGVRALQTTRLGGCSLAPYATLNLGLHVGDAPEAVAANRHCVDQELPAPPVWLEQVHGTVTVRADAAGTCPVADAAVTRQPGVVCAIMTADCLPVLLCDAAGSVVAAAHAGWRGLSQGVLESVVAAMETPPAHLMAWFGPAIGPQAFEVGNEVRATFLCHDPAAAQAFVPLAGGQYHADIFLLARQRLHALGITRIHGGGICTFQDARRFFSHRRDGQTGRMASLIWRD